MTKNFMTRELIKILSLIADSTANMEQCRNYETVTGNSRQEIIQGKCHSWPVAKKRKGIR